MPLSSTGTSVTPVTTVAPDVAPAAGEVFLARLRAETRVLHASAERRMAAADRLRDVRSYARLLKSLSPLYAFVEARAASFADWSGLEPPLALGRRRRAHLLAADLCVLGEAEACTRAATLPQINGFGEAFGALYVIEGSRLGGSILARQVAASVGPAADGALSFLRSGDPAAVGSLWKGFRASLSTYAEDASPDTLDAIVAGAVDTFRCFDRQLEQWAA